MSKSETRLLPLSLSNATFLRFIILCLLLLLSIPLVVLAKHGSKCNNKDCGQNEHSGRKRFSTSPTELLGKKVEPQSHISPPLTAIAFRRSQTMSPVRHYNTLTAAREPTFVTVKRTTEQVVSKPYKVNISVQISLA